MTTILSTREDQYLFTNFQSNYWYMRRVITNKQWTFRIGYENLRLTKWSPYCVVIMYNVSYSCNFLPSPKRRIQIKDRKWAIFNSFCWNTPWHLTTCYFWGFNSNIWCNETVSGSLTSYLTDRLRAYYSFFQCKISDSNCFEIPFSTIYWVHNSFL